ncbi:DUF2533 family protein [Bacillus sp. CGMCC 1.16607]|uniref:DUF2533 family protein n=1 Tax=Bacillus sp. CGMCC 1.16607 TaxID=3351842 RepID=UPI0036441618
MSVHKALEKHAQNQNIMYKKFLELDQKRESYIEEVIELCKQGKTFSTEKINEMTELINQMNMRIVPTRKYVTVEMVQEYVKSKELSEE